MVKTNLSIKTEKVRSSSLVNPFSNIVASRKDKTLYFTISFPIAKKNNSTSLVLGSWIAGLDK